MRLHFAWVPAICGLFLLAAPPAAAQLVVPHGQAFTITTSPNSDTAGRTNIATDGTDFVVVWKDASAQIMASRVTPEGVVAATTSTPLGTTPDAYTEPAIAFDGTNFLVAWVGSAGGALEIYAARLSPSLQILDSPARKLTTGAAPKAKPIPLAFGGGTYLTAWRTASDTIRFARITTAAETVDGPAGVQIGPGGRFYPWVAYGGGVFLVVYHGWGSSSLDVFGTRVAPDGTILGPAEFKITGTSHDEHHVGVVSDGTNFLVEWQDRANSADLEGSTYGTRVSTSGTVLDMPFLIGERSHQQGPATPVFDGTNYFVVWMTEHGRTQSSVGFRSADAFGRRVSPAGAVLDQQAVPVATSWNHQWGATVGYVNNRYLAVWHEASSVRCGAGGNWCVAAQLLSKESGTSPPLITPTSASGETWVGESIGGTSQLFDVYGLDDGTAFATGESQDGSNVPWRRYSGGAWEVWTTVPVGRFYGLWASAPSDAWATGWAAYNYHYDGSTLSLQPCDGCAPAEAAPMGCGIWGDSATSMMAVGVNGFAWKFVPATAGWRVTSPTGTTFDLWDVWGTSPTNVYAVGESGTILRYEGTAWSQESGVPTSQSLNGVWGTSPTDIYAVGDYGTIVHFDGASWTAQNSGTLEHLHGIWGLRPNEIYVVGYGGTILHFNGTTWLHDTGPTTADLFDVWGSAVTGTLWAVGRSGVVFKKTGAGGGCVFATGRAPGPFAQAGGTGGVSLTTACTWTAYSDVPWISVTSSAAGTGSGTIGLKVEPNDSGGPRTGTLRIGSAIATIDQTATRPTGDFDADGLADVAVYRPASGTWFWLESSTANASFAYHGWGVNSEGDIPVRGDFDGDGVVDPTVYRPASGTWFVLKSSSSLTDWTWFGWGAVGDLLVPGNYVGDGITDAAVYRPSTGEWFVRPSSGTSPWSVTFGGQTGDVPLPGDYDGDGRTDIVIYRPGSGTWFILRSSTDFVDWTYRGWGVQSEGDQPVPGDYDGDGKTDLAVYRPGSGTWFILESHAAYTTWSWSGWGTATDQPVPADYDGDGRTDLAIYRPSTGEWWVNPSSGASPWSVVFGQSGDVPLQGIR